MSELGPLVAGASARTLGNGMAAKSDTYIWTGRTWTSLRRTLDRATAPFMLAME
jgi:hypothetical protein